MRFKVKTTGVVLGILVLVGLMLGLLLGRADFLQDQKVALNQRPAISNQYAHFQPEESTKALNTKATIPSEDLDSQAKEAKSTPTPQPSASEADSRLKQLTTAPTPKTKTATPSPTSDPRLKAQKTQKNNNAPKTPSYSVKTTVAFAAYKPRYEIAWADASNYGDRFATDANGTPVNNQPIVVLHETAAPASSAINFFKNSHEDENVQASYHTMIKLDGTVVYLVPPEKRAFGAGNSVFEGPQGTETVKTNPDLPPSVNNFAYHIGLETPPSGVGTKETTHTGYTQEQYSSLAWLIAQSNVPDERITTHKAVDRSGQRIDPRSFDFDRFWNLLHSFRVITPVNISQISN
ncbi:N-acetylmuramoyl-L-alanine amidase [Scytonema sp. NUACC26]|uniref:N-acetylmuramoyl-L-alanine amidase n=1 Tax=Scytonema sp. NUACC26 TaxID=3140176 RepID=UPI0034DC13EA